MSLLLLAGCDLSPRFIHPAVTMAPSFPDRGQQPGPPSIATTGWRDFFAEPELQALIARAIAQNSDIRIAAARVAEAREAIRLRGADLLPQVSTSADMSKIGVPDNLAAFAGKNVFTSYSGFAEARWEIDFFGRLRNLRTEAREQYLASDEARLAVQTSLIAQVAAGYLADREYGERLTLARDSLANRVESLRIISRRYQVGSGSKLEVTQAETLRTQAAAEIETLELARAQNLDALALLAGEPIAAADFRQSLGRIGLDQPIPAGLPSDLLVNRPDIVAAEHRLRAANADIGAARAAFFPSITLTAAGGSESGALGNLFSRGTGLWLFQPSVSLPIFAGGKLRANLRLSEAQRDELLGDYQKAVQSAFRDCADALAQRHWLAEQIVTGEQAVSALTERVRLAKLRYDAGRSAYLEVLDAERDLFSAQQNLVALRRAWLASGVALYAALGGGVSDHIPPAPEARP
ncbi:MAG TPA: efflux transporter outer membrane subunit [Sphingomonas sp.]